MSYSFIPLHLDLFSVDLIPPYIKSTENVEDPKIYLQEKSFNLPLPLSHIEMKKLYWGRILCEIFPPGITNRNKSVSARSMPTATSQQNSLKPCNVFSSSWRKYISENNDNAVFSNCFLDRP